MANDREYLKMIFTSWKQGMKSHEEAARYMRSEALVIPRYDTSWQRISNTRSSLLVLKVLTSTTW
ncbi:hypothetical protein GN244_ATG14264 [Phytophthora infestans]|uniref:Uncharacterized protein n=1 Tax=Phytophthora infestans TaxID=4787 RepID=A0A833WQD7_PHYIN|nr:hypothetical protein GN244_ATG14264 [Phytophthora infestans]KAF4144599.1 hypothetical protein GN958_ATG06206 [Phytophthora infestans]